jgi:ABC-type multidrug transport system fused ATPase/permease subunit
MSKGIAALTVGTLSLLLLSSFGRHSLEEEEHSIRILFYNTENLFDINDDTLTDDNEFLPEGTRRWNYTRYKKKINSICKTIIAAGGWSPPEIIALCETENRKVIEDLTLGTNLDKFDYGIIHEDSPDPRGIDVCLLYRKDIVEVIHYDYFHNTDTVENDFLTRDVLYAKCRVMDDTIHLFVNHWPSKRGGVLSGDKKRKQIAGLVRAKADSVSTAGKDRAKIIITGDFNVSPGDKVLESITSGSGRDTLLINLSGLLDSKSGTYRYRGIWEMPDQLIVSRFLLSCESGLCTEPGMLRIFSPDFLLFMDPVYPGLSPFSTWRGYRYLGGFSDHLPLLIDLKIR